MSIRLYLKSAFLVLFLLLLVLPNASAQYNIQDLDLDGDLTAWYDKEIGLENRGDLRGSYRQLIRYPNTNQFFEENNWSLNQLGYREMAFDSVYLIYDIFDDQVLIRHLGRYQFFNYPIRINTKQVQWFTLNDHFFRYYDESIIGFDPGFFEELYIGENIKVLVKHEKKLRTDQRNMKYYKNEIRIVHYNGTYSKLNGRGSFLRLFNDNKDFKRGLRKFMNSNTLFIRGDEYSDIRMLAEYTDNNLPK